MSTFRYFPDFPKGAQFGTDTCGYCGASAAFSIFHLASQKQWLPACADCIALGRAQVDVPAWNQSQLRHSVKDTHPDWSDMRVQTVVAARVDELAHTPPVPCCRK